MVDKWDLVASESRIDADGKLSFAHSNQWGMGSWGHDWLTSYWLIPWFNHRDTGICMEISPLPTPSEKRHVSSRNNNSSALHKTLFTIISWLWKGTREAGIGLRDLDRVAIIWERQRRPPPLWLMACYGIRGRMSLHSHYESLSMTIIAIEFGCLLQATGAPLHHQLFSYLSYSGWRDLDPRSPLNPIYSLRRVPPSIRLWPTLSGTYYCISGSLTGSSGLNLCWSSSSS